MKIGRLTFNAKRFMHGAANLSIATLVAVYSGGSVPEQFRRYIVTPQDISGASMQAAVESRVENPWQSVGAFVVDNDIMTAMSSRERAVIRAAYQQEINQTNAEQQVRQSIRVPLLPGPVARQVVADNSMRKHAGLDAPAAPTTKAAEPVANKPEQKAAASPLAEDLATIQALKSALEDLKKEGITLGGYRNDQADK